jgi:hypothetical protein
MWLRFASINDTPVKIFNKFHPRHPMEVEKVEREVLKKYLVLRVVFKAIKSSMLVPSEWQARRKKSCNIEERANGFLLQAWLNWRT